jgi:RNA polymerase sigma factor (sigma-70 family)
MPPPAEGFAARLVLGPALRTQPDRRLVRLVREGYEAAFEEIVRRYGRPLNRYAAAIVGSRAEDVIQDSFSKALLALRRDGKEIELRPWLFRIVRNTALNDLRDRPPSAQELAESLVGGGGNPAEELERREELAELIRRLRALPDAQRAAIVMRELEGLGHDEIAAALGLSGGAARQAIFRARRALRDGAGMLLPLPLLKGLLSGGAATPMEAAAGAGGVGAAGIGGAAGASVALKAATATVLVAGVVGAGVAIDHNRHGDGPASANAEQIVADGPSADAASADGERAASNRSASGTAGEHRQGGDLGSGSGRRGAGGSSGAGRGPGDRHSGERGGEGSGHGGGDRHHQSSGGPPGTGSPHEDGDGERHSGRSPDGSGNSGEGSSGGGDPGDEHDPGGGESGSGGEQVSSSGEGSGDGGGSDPNSGPSSGDGGGEDGGTSEDSGDPHGGEGFSVQTEPQTQEEP